MKMTTHYATSFKKMSNKHGEWGKKTLCGKKFKVSSKNLTYSQKWVNCASCLEILLSKREKEIEYLRWAVSDLKTIGYRRLRTPTIYREMRQLNDPQVDS